MIQFKRIMVPTDFSEHARRAVKYALELPLAEDGEFLFVHTIEPTAYPIHQVIQGTGALSLERQVRTMCESHLEDLCKEVGARAKTRTLLLDGHASSELAATAKREEADLIVIATRGNTGLKHFFLGSTAESVVRHAPCPVLTVRTDPPDAES